MYKKYTLKLARHILVVEIGRKINHGARPW